MLLVFLLGMVHMSWIFICCEEMWATLYISWLITRNQSWEQLLTTFRYPNAKFQNRHRVLGVGLNESLIKKKIHGFYFKFLRRIVKKFWAIEICYFRSKKWPFCQNVETRVFESPLKEKYCRIGVFSFFIPSFILQILCLIFFRKKKILLLILFSIKILNFVNFLLCQILVIWKKEDFKDHNASWWVLSAII